VNYKEFLIKVALVAVGFAASKIVFNNVRGTLGV